MKWIDVKDSVPITNKKVLAFDTYRTYIAYRTEEDGVDYNEHWAVCEDQDCSCLGCTGAITHWMPLPDAPNG